MCRAWSPLNLAARPWELRFSLISRNRDEPLEAAEATIGFAPLGPRVNAQQIEDASGRGEQQARDHAIDKARGHDALRARQWIRASSAGRRHGGRGGGGGGGG